MASAAVVIEGTWTWINMGGVAGNNTISLNISTTAVTEPSALALLGVLALGLGRRRRRGE